MSGPNTRRYVKFQNDLNKVWAEYHQKLDIAKKEFEKDTSDMRWDIYAAQKVMLDSEVHQKVNKITSGYLSRFFG